MRPIVTSVTGVGEGPVVVLDKYATPLNVGLVVVVTGTITYTVQHTFEDPFDENFNPATATWFTTPGFHGGLD